MCFSADLSIVMAGLVPAIHAFPWSQGVDARHKAGHDEREDAEPDGREGGMREAKRSAYSNPSTIRTSRSAPLPSAFSAF